MATVRSALDVMGEFYDRNRANQEWREWFIMNDIAIPLAYLCFRGMAQPTDEVVTYVHETWESFCNTFGVDPHNDFDTLDAFMDLVDNPEVPA